MAASHAFCRRLERGVNVHGDWNAFTRCMADASIRPYMAMP
jgi:hypothetical protein